jgi:hypothetical protein
LLAWASSASDHARFRAEMTNPRSAVFGVTVSFCSKRLPCAPIAAPLSDQRFGYCKRLLRNGDFPSGRSPKPTIRSPPDQGIPDQLATRFRLENGAMAIGKGRDAVLGPASALSCPTVPTNSVSDVMN